MKGLLIFLAGGAVGSLATYFIVRKHFADIADQEIADIKEWARDAIKTKASQLTASLEESAKMDSFNEEDREAMINKYAAVLRDFGYSVELDAAAAEDIEELDEEAINPPSDETGIEVIDETEYAMYHSDYDKVGLTFYAGDYTFVDDVNSQPLPAADVQIAIGNIEDYVPVDKIQVDSDALYIRNHDLATDYEIMLMPQAFINA